MMMILMDGNQTIFAAGLGGVHTSSAITKAFDELEGVTRDEPFNLERYVEVARKLHDAYQAKRRLIARVRHKRSRGLPRP